MKNIILTVWLLFAYLLTTAQEQPPVDNNRKQIETTYARIIFSEEVTPAALKTAQLIDTMYEHQHYSLKSPAKKTPILLYNSTVVSNGYAALMPRRSVWQTTGMQKATDLGNSNWLTTLGTHEYRHLVQHAKYNQNFTKFLTYFFGQTGILIGRYSVPYWFSEGDAICIETAFTNNGRGRIPKFEMPAKAIILENNDFSYYKIKLGSYKNYLPNHYHWGWLLASYGRTKYGYDIWDKVLNRTSEISYWPWAFSKSLKKHTGLNEKHFFDQAMNYYDSLWSNQLKEREITPIRQLSPKNNSYADHTEGAVTKNGELIFLSQDLNTIKHVMKMDTAGNIQQLKPTVAEMFSLNNETICYTKTFYDKRYNYETYSDVILYNLSSGKKKRLTLRKKYFAPAFSPDGKKIVLIESGKDMQHRLLVIDSRTGKPIKALANTHNLFLRTPVWSADGKHIAYTASGLKGSSLITVNYKSGLTDTLISESNEIFDRPVFYKNYLLYNSNFDGIGNIYAVHRNTKKQYRVCSSKYGAYLPKVSADSLIFSDYTPKGYRVASLKIKPEILQAKTTADIYISETAKTITEQENFTIPDFSKNNPKKYKIEDYKPFKDAVKIHSWGLYSESLSKMSFNVYSSNLLNTVWATAGASYDINEKTFGANTHWQFSKYLPVIKLSGSYNQRYINDTDNNYTDRWNETSTGISFGIPFRLRTGTWFEKLEPEVGISYKFLSGNGSFAVNNYTLNYYILRRQAHRNIYPKWGTVLRTEYRHLPFSDDYRAFQFSAIGKQYLPGFFANHSITLSGAYEQQEEPENSRADYYWFASPVYFTRGYDAQIFSEMYKLSGEYHLPLWYPDLAAGSIIYFKRLRASLFYDYQNLKTLNGTSADYSSAGMELYLKFDIFNLEQDFEIGGRASYLPGNQEMVYEFIMAGLPFSF